MPSAIQMREQNLGSQRSLDRLIRRSALAQQRSSQHPAPTDLSRLPSQHPTPADSRSPVPKPGSRSTTLAGPARSQRPVHSLARLCAHVSGRPPGEHSGQSAKPSVGLLTVWYEHRRVVRAQRGVVGCDERSQREIAARDRSARSQQTIRAPPTHRRDCPGRCAASESRNRRTARNPRREPSVGGRYDKTAVIESAEEMPSLGSACSPRSLS